MKRWIAALSLVVAAGCGPTVNSKMQAATIALLNKPVASHSVGAVKGFKPMPWAVGQWAIYVMRDIQRGRPSVMKIGVVGQESNGALWVEIDTQDYFHHTISKTLYAKMPRTAEEAADAVLKVITKTDDQAPQTMDFTSNEPGVAMMKSLMKSTMQGVYAPAVETASFENVNVPAGSFAGCTKATAKVSFGPVKAESTGWFHPGVPINATVKSEATDGSWMMELLDYGTSGATSAL